MSLKSFRNTCLSIELIEAFKGCLYKSHLYPSSKIALIFERNKINNKTKMLILFTFTHRNV